MSSWWIELTSTRACDPRPIHLNKTVSFVPRLSHKVSLLAWTVLGGLCSHKCMPDLPPFRVAANWDRVTKKCSRTASYSPLLLLALLEIIFLFHKIVILCVFEERFMNSWSNLSKYIIIFTNHSHIHAVCAAHLPCHASSYHRSRVFLKEPPNCLKWKLNWAPQTEQLSLFAAIISIREMMMSSRGSTIIFLHLLHAGRLRFYWLSLRAPHGENILLSATPSYICFEFRWNS